MVLKAISAALGVHFCILASLALRLTANASAQSGPVDVHNARTYPYLS
jgi:hypothetical protein